MGARLAILALIAAASATAAAAAPLDGGLVTTLAPDAPSPPSELQPEQEAAVRAFAEGNALMHDARFSKAAERYRAALASWDHPAIHYNLALALINLDQPVAALEALEHAIKYGPGSLGDDRFAEAQATIARLERTVGHVEVSNPKAPVTLHYDGLTILSGPGTWTARVRAGRHTLSADAADYQGLVFPHAVAAGELTRIELHRFSNTDGGCMRRRFRRRWAPYAVIGAGAMTLAIGGFVHQHAPNASTALFIGGGVVVAGGVTLVVLNRPRPCPGPPPPPFFLSPRLTTEELGVSASVRF